MQWRVDETGSVLCPMVNGRNRLRTVQWWVDCTGSGLWPTVSLRLGGIQPSGSAISVSVCVCVYVYVCSRQILHMIQRCYTTQLHRDRRSDATTSSPQVQRGTVWQRSAGATSWQLRDYRATHGLRIAGWKLYSAQYVLTVLSKSQLVGRCRSVQFPLTDSTVRKFLYINHRLWNATNITITSISGTGTQEHAVRSGAPLSCFRKK